MLNKNTYHNERIPYIVNKTKRIMALGVLLSSLSISACGNSDSGTQEQHDSSISQSSSVPEAPILAPEIKDDNSNYETFTADKDASKKLDKAGDKVKDEWFIKTVRESGYDDSTDRLLKTRDNVCNMINEKTTFRNISDALSEQGIPEKEQGSIISASMTSHCADKSIKIKKEVLENTK